MISKKLRIKQNFSTMMTSNEYDVRRPNSTFSSKPNIHNLSTSISKDVGVNEFINPDEFRQKITEILPNEFANFKYKNKLNRKDELKKLLK